MSPDGRWIESQSDESGQNEGYVKSFPTPGGRRAFYLFAAGVPPAPKITVVLDGQPGR